MTLIIPDRVVLFQTKAEQKKSNRCKKKQNSVRPVGTLGSLSSPGGRRDLLCPPRERDTAVGEISQSTFYLSRSLGASLCERPNTERHLL